MRMRLLSAIMLGLLLQGCSSTQVGEQREEAFASYHRTTAKALIETGRYHQARTHLQILNAYRQGTAELDGEIRLLDVLIETKTAPLLSQAKSDLKRGRTTSARKNLLRALAINPGNEEAFLLLRQLTSNQRRHKQGDDVVSSYATSPALPTEHFREYPVIVSRQPLVTTPHTPPEQTSNAVSPVSAEAVAATPEHETQSKPAKSITPVKRAAEPPPVAKHKLTQAPDTQPAEKAEADNITVAMRAAEPVTPTLAEEYQPSRIKAAAEPEHVAEKERQTESDTERERFLAPYRSYYEKREYAALIRAAKYIPQEQKIPSELKGWLFDAHLQQAMTLRRRNNLNAALTEASTALDYADDQNRARADTLLQGIRSQLSHDLYIQGKKVFYTDIEKAISLWEMALIYKENSPEIKHQLKKAYLIRKNLGTIQLEQ